MTTRNPVRTGRAAARALLPGAIGLILAAVALSGCLGGGREESSPLGGPAPPEPSLPPGIEPVVVASHGVEPIPLQAMLMNAEAFRRVPSIPREPPDETDPVAAVLRLFDAVEREVPPDALPSILALARLPPDAAVAVAHLAAATADAQGLVADAAVNTQPDWLRLFQAERVQLAAVESALMRLPSVTPIEDGAPVSVCGILFIDVSDAANLHECDYLLLIDAGGDDVYANHAGGTAFIYTANLALDLAGNDRYVGSTADHAGVTGGAFMGVGLLVDAAGNDVYDVRGEEGTGLNGAGNAAGVGFLADLAGSDFVRAAGGLHAAVNGGGWSGSGHLLLVDGPDVVEGQTPSLGGLNGGGWEGTGTLVGLRGDRTYRARDPGGMEASAANGGGYWSGRGLLVDDGGATRYESLLGPDAAGNGGGYNGDGLLFDLGGGDDEYLAPGSLRSSLNGGGSHGGTGLLFDDGGHDLYQEGAEATAIADDTRIPKGASGAQIDATLPLALRLPTGASPLRELVAAMPAESQRVLEAIRSAAQQDFRLASLGQIQIQQAGVESETSADEDGPAPTLPLALERLLVPEGEVLTPSQWAQVGSLPLDVQKALARLLDAYVHARQDFEGADDAEPGSPDRVRRTLEARQRLLVAVEDARPVLQRHAGRSLLATPIDLCGVLNLDLTSQPASYACDYSVQIVLGGDNVYRNKAGSPTQRGGVGLLVDAAGNDAYLGPEGAYGERSFDDLPDALGSASQGIGFLADLAGDDRYEPGCPDGCVVIGSGESGAGALVDFSGNDVYRYAGPTANNGSFAIGSGVRFGFGLLADLGGDDQYVGQGPDGNGINGVGAMGGGGFLFDRAGHDTYHAATGAHGLANGATLGGIGLLLDLAGSDHYWGQIGHHGQSNGAGFLAGPLSGLIDLAGDDAYVGVGTAGPPSANGNAFAPGACLLPAGCDKAGSLLLDLGGRDAYIEWDTSAGQPQAGHHHGHGDAPPAPVAPMPEPAYDQTIVPKGDGGAQLDVTASLA